MENIRVKPIIASNVQKYNRPDAAKMKSMRIILVLCGVAIGIVNGLFGAGGGMLAVPVLSFVAKLDERHAHATAIAVILPLCAVSSVVYALGGGADWGVFIPTIIGVTIGGIISAVLLKKISNDYLPFIFYTLMLFAGLKMIF